MIAKSSWHQHQHCKKRRGCNGGEGGGVLKQDKNQCKKKKFFSYPHYSLGGGFRTPRKLRNGDC